MNTSRNEKYAQISGQDAEEPKARQIAGAGSFRKAPRPREISELNLEIVYQDKYFCIVNKPAGVPSQTQGSDKDIITLTAESIKKPKTSLHLVNRLDQPVSGLLIIAFSRDIHAAFEALRRSNSLNKTYLAIVSQTPDTISGFLRDFLLRDSKANRSNVVSAGTKGCKEARLKWVMLAQAESVDGQKLAIMAIRLETGRHHQIRVQLANAGWPILGDKKYGSSQYENSQNIALISFMLDFHHPVSGTEMSLKLKLPDYYPYCQFSDISEQFDSELFDK